MSQCRVQLLTRQLKRLTVQNVRTFYKSPPPIRNVRTFSQMTKPSLSPVTRRRGGMLVSGSVTCLGLGGLVVQGMRWSHHFSAQCEGSLVQNRLAALQEEISEQYECSQSFQWRELVNMLLPEMLHLIGAVLSAFAVALVNIQIPVYLGELVNVVSQFTRETEANFAEAVRAPALKLLGVYAVQAILSTVYISLLSSVGERLAANMRVRLFDSIIEQDVMFFDSHRSGDIINRLTSDVQDFKSSFKLCISQGLRSATQIIGSTVALLYISPKLTGVLTISLPVIVGTGTLLGSGLRKLSRQTQMQISRSTAVADEAVGNVRTVRAFSMEDKEKQLYSREVWEACRLNQQLGLGIGLFQGLSNFALNGIVLGVIYTGGLLMSTNELSAGDLMSFLVASQTIQRSLAQMSLLFGQAVRGLSAGQRVLEYIALRPKIRLHEGVKDNLLLQQARKPNNQHKICFQNVQFSYPARPEQPVLNKLNLEIPCGQVLALCGLSGAGKSTIAALLERFYDVDGGCILVCNRQLTSLNPSWFRQHMIGYISQEPQLFATTVLENIRYGRPDATDEEVIAAARLANADQFISAFPDQYHTVIGERGCTVSGGQKQRIAIARALLKDPPILILDEATSALDAESERLVQEALDRAMKGRTVIVIAHRLSTIKNADTIAVLAKGQVAERGKHADLLKTRGLYWEFIKHQQFEQDFREGKARPFIAGSFWSATKDD